MSKHQNFLKLKDLTIMWRMLNYLFEYLYHVRLFLHRGMWLHRYCIWLEKGEHDWIASLYRSASVENETRRAAAAASEGVETDYSECMQRPCFLTLADRQTVVGHGEHERVRPSVYSARHTLCADVLYMPLQAQGIDHDNINHHWSMALS